MSALSNVSANRFAEKVDAEGVIDIDFEAEKVKSFLAEGDEFIGELKCATGIRISGKVSGSVICKTGAIVLEKTGVVTGSIQGSDKIFIDGTVGSAEGAERVKIISTGLITLMNHCVANADIEYGKLATYGDMTHNGSCKKLARKD